MAAGPAFTANPLALVTISPPVVRVTLRAPVVVSGSIDIDALAVVALLTVREFSVIPAPNVAVVVPCTQCVKFPVSATLARVWPCTPLLGLTVVSTGVPAATVNPLASEAVSFGVVTVTVRKPMAAVGSMARSMVSEVRLFTVIVPVTMPAPKVTELAPCAKCVPVPVRVAVIAWPCCPVLGETVVIAAPPAVTVKALESVTISPPVVTVTVRAPRAVRGLIVTEAVAEVKLFTVNELSVMPVPKLAVVVPCTQ